MKNILFLLRLYEATVDGAVALEQFISLTFQYFESR